MHAHPLWDGFEIGSPVHLAGLGVVAGVCAGVGWVGRAVYRRGRSSGRTMDLAFAAVVALFYLVTKTLRVMPGALRWDQSLPLHVCDVAAVAAVLGLASWRRLPRNLLFYLGLGVCPAALLFPLMSAGPAHLLFWVYWVYHTLILSAAVYEITARGYRPDWRDLPIVFATDAVYATAALVVDARLRVNYGFLGPTFHTTSQVAAFGPWPARVPRLLMGAYLVQWLMAVSPGAALSVRRYWRGMVRANVVAHFPRTRAATLGAAAPAAGGAFTYPLIPPPLPPASRQVA